MKNFDMSVYEQCCASMFTDTSAWEEMCRRCDAEYKNCSSHFSKSFQEWYENGYFHDAILKRVSPILQEKGKWSLDIFLEPRILNAPRRTVLKYTGVTSFSIRKSEDAESSWKEECLYGEFYRLEKTANKVVHEFFTTSDTFFYIEFEKLTCEEYEDDFFAPNQPQKRRHRFSLFWKSK